MTIISELTLKAKNTDTKVSVINKINVEVSVCFIAKIINKVPDKVATK